MYLHWTRRTRTFNVSILSIQKRTMNKNLCQLCPNIMPTIIVTLGQRWANVILKIFWRWANIAPTCWANVGTLCTYNVGPTLKANVGPTKWTTLAQRWANVCVLSGKINQRVTGQNFDCLSYTNYRALLHLNQSDHSLQTVTNQITRYKQWSCFTTEHFWIFRSG